MGNSAVSVLDCFDLKRSSRGLCLCGFGRLDRFTACRSFLFDFCAGRSLMCLPDCRRENITQTIDKAMTTSRIRDIAMVMIEIDTVVVCSVYCIEYCIPALLHRSILLAHMHIVKNCLKMRRWDIFNHHAIPLALGQYGIHVRQRSHLLD